MWRECSEATFAICLLRSDLGIAPKRGQVCHFKQYYVSANLGSTTKVGMEGEGCRMLWRTAFGRYMPNMTDAAVSFRLILAPSARLSTHMMVCACSAERIGYSRAQCGSLTTDKIVRFVRSCFETIPAGLPELS